jgi:hypothetical protein
VVPQTLEQLNATPVKFEAFQKLSKGQKWGKVKDE